MGLKASNTIFVSASQPTRRRQTLQNNFMGSKRHNIAKIEAVKSLSLPLTHTIGQMLAKKTGVGPVQNKITKTFLS